RGAEARRPSCAPRRSHQRSRCSHRPRAREHPGRRRAAASDDRRRTVPARSGAGGVPEVVRRAQNARAHSTHAENGQAAPQLLMLPVILVAGIQGRWEYMRPAVDALSKHFRVLTFSLCNARTLDAYVDQVVGTMDAEKVERAVVLGVSFGGLVALRFAATSPERTDSLVLASTPAPGWRLRPRHLVYARLPWVFGPLFLMESPWRLRMEFNAALPVA